MNERRTHSPEFKAKAALEALKNPMTLSELSRKYDVNQNFILKWKTKFLENASSVFENSLMQSNESKEVDNLYNQTKLNLVKFKNNH